MPETYKIISRAGDGRHPCSPYGIRLSVNTEVNITLISIAVQKLFAVDRSLMSEIHMTERDNGNTSNISWLRWWLEQFQGNVRPAVA